MDAVKALVVAAVRLAIVRHGHETDDGEIITDEDAQAMAEDVWDALNGVGTCAEEPAPELLALAARPAPASDSDAIAACKAMLATWGSQDEDAIIAARDMARAAVERAAHPAASVRMGESRVRPVVPIEAGPAAADDDAGQAVTEHSKSVGEAWGACMSAMKEFNRHAHLEDSVAADSAWEELRNSVRALALSMGLKLPPAADRGRGRGEGEKGMRLRVYYLPNWDGVNSALVAATNQKEACRLLNSSVSNFRDYGGRRLTDGHEYAKTALSEPGRVWIRRIALTRREEEPWSLR